MNTQSAHCDYCGLPIPPTIWRGNNRPDSHQTVSPEYCCFGCRLAAAVTRERGERGSARGMLTRLGVSLFCAMNVMAFTMALWTGDFYGDSATTAGGAALSESLSGLFRYLCLLFSLPVLLLLGVPLAVNAWDGLRNRRLSTDLLLVVGVLAAYGYSAVSVFRNAGPVYFEVGCVVLVLVTLGRWLEANGRVQAGAALDELQKLLPENVRVLADDTEVLTPALSLMPGHHVRVLPGERFPTDGRLLNQPVSVDQQVLTGESWPIVKEPGELLLGGSLNLDAEAIMNVTASPQAGTLSRLIAAVREAREARGWYQRLADRLSAWFFPAIVLIAISAGMFHGLRSGWDHGGLTALAVILIACPCALGLATPLAMWSALGHAARYQVLFRSGEALERLAQVKVILFDKTGTLTSGHSRIVRFAAAAGCDPELVRLAATMLAAGSTHPISRAILAGSEMVDEIPRAEQVRSHPGRGISGICRWFAGESEVRLGNLKWLTQEKERLPIELEQITSKASHSGQPLAGIAWGGMVRGVFLFAEELRPEAAEALQACRDTGCEIAVLTGDHAGRGRHLAGDLLVRVLAELLPEDKVTAVKLARFEFGPVAFVGDGVNDAPALAASDVGIALGCGADVSRESAAVCLLGNDLSRVAWSVHFARRVIRTIRRNLLWAFSYNLVGVALAASGHLNPAFAALLMVASSLLVVTAALRIGSRAGDSQAELPKQQLTVVKTEATAPQSSTNAATAPMTAIPASHLPVSDKSS